MGGDLGSLVVPILGIALILGIFLYLRGGGNEARREANMILTIWLAFFVPAFVCTSVSILSAIDALNYENSQSWVTTWIVLAVLYAASTFAVTALTARLFMRKLSMATAHYAIFLGAVTMVMMLTGMFALWGWISVIGFE